MEVASLLSDVALGEDGKPSLHIQCELSGRDGDPESRLALIDPGSPD